MTDNNFTDEEIRIAPFLKALKENLLSARCEKCGVGVIE